MSTPQKIKTRPITKEAIHLVDLSMATIKAVLVFMGQAVASDEMTQNKFYDYCAKATDDEGLFITTLEGTMKADIGDWVVRGVGGEFYPIKPDAFAKTYEII